MGRTPEVVELTFQVNGSPLTKTVETFTWEKLDYVDQVKKSFGL
jgi:S-adenosylmethionine synthetase